MFNFRKRLRMKFFPLLLAIFIPSYLFAQTPSMVSPLVPGTYTLNEKTEAQAAKSGGPFGKLIVSEPVNNKSLFHLRYSTGAPANNLGLIKDSLTVYGDRTFYRTNEDSSCRVSFEFTDKGVTIQQTSTAGGFACGFGRNVHVDGFYTRNKTVALPAIRTGTRDIEIFWAEWMSWDKPGKATVTNLGNGKYRIVGKQIGRDNKGYMTMDGTLQMISATEMEFNGTIISQEAIINQGKICKREGKIKLSKSKRFNKWVSDKVRNWGGQTVDEYITISY
jgi:hypothetical protein